MSDNAETMLLSDLQKGQEMAAEFVLRFKDESRGSCMAAAACLAAILMVESGMTGPDPMFILIKHYFAVLDEEVWRPAEAANEKL